MERQTIDQSFNDTYVTKGLQPSTGVPAATRNPKATYTENSNPPPRDTPATAPDTGRRTLEKSTRTVSRRRAGIKRISRGSSSVSSKVRAARTTFSIWSWAIPAWLMFQIPFAVLNLIMFGAAMAVEAVFNLATVNPDDSILTQAVKGAFNAFTDGVASVAETISSISSYLFDFDIVGLFDPTNFFLVTYVIILAFALIQILIIYLIYKVFGLEPLGGSGSNLKYGSLLLAIIGYCIPGLNLFPWILVWTGAVMLKQE